MGHPESVEVDAIASYFDVGGHVICGQFGHYSPSHIIVVVSAEDLSKKG